VAKRQYIIKIIKNNFEVWFSTHRNTIVWKFRNFNGKYGEEGDRLILKFWIWDYLAKPIHLENKDSTKLTSSISEKALRYDLTVPFARCCTTSERYWIPLKRYQIQPVAQTGLRRDVLESFQCDADVVGSKSLWQEVELVQLYDTVLPSWDWKEWPLKLILE
jgi:histidyl-tRNA synthetase